MLATWSIYLIQIHDYDMSNVRALAGQSEREKWRKGGSRADQRLTLRLVQNEGKGILHTDKQTYTQTDTYTHNKTPVYHGSSTLP